MKDRQAIDFLCAKLDPDGGQANTAKALQVSSQVLTNWRTRGIAALRRLDVWELLNKHGANLPLSWAKKAA